MLWKSFASIAQIEQVFANENYGSEFVKIIL